MSSAPPFRIGYGYDIHRLVPAAESGRPLVLGGVHFTETDCALDGHSDADVLTHAICDALLGAAGLPDIGHFFPNTDPAFKDIDSQKLLLQTCAELRNRGYEIGNIDASLVAEKPKIAPRLAEMKARLAQSMQVASECVGIKATTNEGVDEIGRGLAIAAHAVALIYQSRQR
ncbi:2-C-methyl-D-erythritol 4-phosphate cytidylyltransferase [Cephaloticoccus primus]|uniref:2-C-methyl-D-erythritol 2,4-cyclodiphosphate synthase n=1 Tax=Cephaloticoccus primus TaxID=1548207 RepID=A0A139SMR0_9BACT|nr:2-C-methyl-D-erythritol 2,4-cyclodiphosphate synthase [Cephaloticoccus primus]KXU35799.1 2-C-methyl-D-erythritol 4-phosphate cytidylyltransferase [Cephaloticoccus primus]